MPDPVACLCERCFRAICGGEREPEELTVGVISGACELCAAKLGAGERFHPMRTSRVESSLGRAVMTRDGLGRAVVGLLIAGLPRPAAPPLSIPGLAGRRSRHKGVGSGVVVRLVCRQCAEVGFRVGTYEPFVGSFTSTLQEDDPCPDCSARLLRYGFSAVART